MIITSEFATEIRGKLTHGAGGTTRNKMDFFLEHHATQDMKDITAEMDSIKKMWRHHSFFGHCTPMDP